MKLRVEFVVAAVAWAGLAGCGDAGPKMVPINGTVTLNDKPLEGATVVFSPDPANKDGQVATDTTGPDGNYKAMTSGRSGVVPGKYKVTVVKSLVDLSNLSPEDREDPYMAQLANGPIDPLVKSGKKGAADTEIKGEFDRDIPPDGGTQDFDVKSSTKTK